MKKTCVVVAMAVMVTGCASVRLGDLGHLRVVIAQDPTAPNISIAKDTAQADNIVIDQEPIVVPTTASSGGVTTIKWALPAFSPYNFNANANANTQGINIVGYHGGPGPSNLYCTVDGTATGTACVAKVCTCSYTTPLVKGTKYEYTVDVINSTTGQTLQRLDPTVWN